MNHHRPRRQFRLAALASELIGPPAGDLQRRERRRPLVDPPDQARGGPCELFPSGNRDAGQLGHVPLDILGGALPAQQKRPSVSLGHPLHVSDQPRGGADADHEHAGGERVEGAGVAGLDRSRQPFDEIDRLPRGHTGRLVKVQYPAKRHGRQRD